MINSLIEGSQDLCLQPLYELWRNITSSLFSLFFCDEDLELDLNQVNSQMVISSLDECWKLVETNSKIAKTMLQFYVINSIKEFWKAKNFVRLNEKSINWITTSAIIFSRVRCSRMLTPYLLMIFWFSMPLRSDSHYFSSSSQRGFLDASID